MNQFLSNVKTLPQRAHLHLEQVPIAAGYKADRQQVIASLVEMIREDLVTERIAVESYAEVLRWLGNDDPSMRNLIKDILKKEEEHADDLSNMLKTFNRENAPTQAKAA